MERALGVGIIGVGAIAQGFHLPAYRDQPDAQVLAVADVDVDRARAVAGQFEIPRAYGDWADLLDDPGIDLVSVCTPNATHVAVVASALEAGKHVLCEKPPATSAAEAIRMKTAAERSGRLLMYCFNSRFRPDVRQLHRYVEAGELGAIYYARATILRRRGAPGGWFANRSLAGGGVLLDIGVHCIDWTRWLIGSPRAVEVFGVTHAKLGTYQLDDVAAWVPADLRAGPVVRARQGDVEEMAAAMIRFENGATLTIEVSWSLDVEKDVTTTELFGSRGGARLEPLGIFQDEYGRMVNKTLFVPSLGGHGTHSRVMRHFLDCAKGAAEPEITPQDGVEVMEILDGIYRSAETGQSVSIGQGS